MGTSILGVVLAALKPIWIWGTVASAITMVPTSGLVLSHINRKDPEFKKYLEERGPVKNVLHFIKSAAKIFIPLYNVVHPFNTLGKLINLGVSGLKSKWENKIYDTDAALNNVKKIGTGTKDIAVGLVNRIKNLKKDTVEKTEKPKVTTTTKTKAPVVKQSAPVQTKVSTQTVKPAVKQTKPVTQVRKSTPVKTQTTKPVTRKKTSYELLVEKLDAINASNYETSEILKYYQREYWAARERYDKLLEAGMDTTEEMNKIILFYNKCQEFEQMRGLTQKPAQLARK